MRTRSIAGPTLALLLALACATPLSAVASQSASFVLQESGAGDAAGIAHESMNYRMQGDISWRQESPLTGQSFRITTAPPAPESSASSSSSSASAQDESDASGGGGDAPRPPVVRPPSSASVSSSSSRATSESASSSSAAESPSSPGASSSDASSSFAGASTASSEASHGAAEPPAGDDGPSACDTVLCPGWTPVDLTPGEGTPSGPWISDSVIDAINATITACTTTYSSLILFALSFVLGGLVSLLFVLILKRGNPQTVVWYATLAAAGAATVTFFCVQSASAAVSSPQRHVYNGHLLNAAGQAITAPHSIRFSEWYSRDMQATDVTASGAINTAAPAYAGYHETFTVTPDAQGYFSVVLGTGAALPDLAAMAASDLDNLFLQVEVKAAAAADTAYEVLDVDPSDEAVDRSPILSVPFAQNADLLDQRGLGTGSGSIPVLGSGGLMPVSTVPGGTNADTFAIDADGDAASDVTLQFGSSLAATLRYDVSDGRFVFGGDLEVQGDLVVSGLINGIDISTIAGSDDGKLRVSSGAGLTINVTGGSYRINGAVTDYTGASGVAVQANATNYVFIGSGGLTVRTSGYPDDESFIRLATVITNGTGVMQIQDGRIVQSDDREHRTETRMHAEFPNASYQADAVDNVGQLSVQLDNITLRNFYQWESTRPTLQDYDVAVRFALPQDFVRWESDPLAVSYRTTSAASTDSRIDVSVFDTNGGAVTLGGGATGLASTSWATAELTYAGGSTWTAGEDMLLRVKLSAKDSYQAHLGTITLRYVRLTP